MSTLTDQLVGELVIEGLRYADQQVHGVTTVDYPEVLRRPLDVVLQNDGTRHYWMLAGEQYCVAHDGTGWRVTCQTWSRSSHVYRLADPDGRFTSVLPGRDRQLQLDLGKAYQLREITPHLWGLYEVTPRRR